MITYIHQHQANSDTFEDSLDNVGDYLVVCGDGYRTAYAVVLDWKRTDRERDVIPENGSQYWGYTLVYHGGPKPGDLGEKGMDITGQFYVAEKIVVNVESGLFYDG